MKTGRSTGWEQKPAADRGVKVKVMYDLCFSSILCGVAIQRLFDVQKIHHPDFSDQHLASEIEGVKYSKCENWTCIYFLHLFPSHCDELHSGDVNHNCVRPLRISV